jgi:hypothetical protein
MTVDACRLLFGLSRLSAIEALARRTVARLPQMPLVRLVDGILNRPVLNFPLLILASAERVQPLVSFVVRLKLASVVV